MYTASSRSTIDIMIELLDKGFCRVTNLNGDYSDDTARSVLHEMEKKHYAHRIRDRAHTYYIGYELSIALSACGIDHEFIQVDDAGAMTYEEFQDAYKTTADELTGDVQ